MMHFEILCIASSMESPLITTSNYIKWIYDIEMTRFACSRLFAVIVSEDSWISIRQVYDYLSEIAEKGSNGIKII